MELSPDEMRLWHAWKRASERVRASVAQELLDAVGLSDPDFGVLSRLSDGGGVLRQNELAASMGWHRSRLSHQLTRMQQRGLVQRRTVSAGVEVLITTEGSAALSAALPVHADAVRHHLTGLVPEGHRRRLATELERLADPAARQPPDGG